MANDIPTDPELTAELQKTSDELKELEGRIKTGMIDVRVLVEFRQAINHVRHTAFAVQRWIQEEKSGGDPYSVLTVVMAERMRIATQLARDLAHDVESGDIDFDTPGTKELHQAAKQLLENLGRLVRE